VAASDAARVQWFDVNYLPSLAFDHAEILALARRRLQTKVEEDPEAFQFLPATFTLDDLRALHEIVRGERLDPRDFRRRVLSVGLIEEAGETRTASGRPARLYRAPSRNA
jgi:8-oxo-dGTP diphosphatase